MAVKQKRTCPPHEYIQVKPLHVRDIMHQWNPGHGKPRPVKLKCTEWRCACGAAEWFPMRLDDYKTYGKHNRIERIKTP